MFVKDISKISKEKKLNQGQQVNSVLSAFKLGQSQFTVLCKTLYLHTNPRFKLIPPPVPVTHPSWQKSRHNSGMSTRGCSISCHKHRAVNQTIIAQVKLHFIVVQKLFNTSSGGMFLDCRELTRDSLVWLDSTHTTLLP